MFNADSLFNAVENSTTTLSVSTPFTDFNTGVVFDFDTPVKLVDFSATSNLYALLEVCEAVSKTTVLASSAKALFTSNFL